MTFQDTAIAFSYRSDAELRRAKFIFSLVNHPWISAIATGLTRWAFYAGIPIDGIVKKTAYQHFCGGETIEDSEKVIQKLWQLRVGSILDYSAEGAMSEDGLDIALQELLKTIDKASKTEGLPFSVFKPTGIGLFELLEKVQRGDKLSSREIDGYEKIKKRIDTICSAAFKAGVPVLIDAEESWIQDPIDKIAEEMMAKYNKEKAVVFNTYQMYRTSSFRNLRMAHEQSVKGNYWLGVKAVRGAYMEKERERAKELGYESPIHPDKEATDKAFNESLLYCADHLDRIALMCGSHNEYSNLYLTRLMEERRILKSDKRIWFAQLYGMSDHITFNLAKAGYNVAKYVPYGPVKTVMPYLLRRAEENTSVAGQSSRELTLIRRELHRRRLSAE